MQTGAGFDLCSPQNGAAGIQFLPTTGPRLRKSRNCWTWQDWDLIYLQRQGTQTGKVVSEGLSGLASSSSPVCTAHTSSLGLGHCLPPKVLTWKQVSRAPGKQKERLSLAWQPRQDRPWLGHRGICPLLISGAQGEGCRPQINNHNQ